eukprot:556912-Rhodomonas_salina.2
MKAGRLAAVTAMDDGQTVRVASPPYKRPAIALRISYALSGGSCCYRGAIWYALCCTDDRSATTRLWTPYSLGC